MPLFNDFCSRCRGVLRTAYTCEVCTKSFHLSCLRDYIKSKSSTDCCKSKFDYILQKPEVKEDETAAQGTISRLQSLRSVSSKKSVLSNKSSDSSFKSTRSRSNTDSSAPSPVTPTLPLSPTSDSVFSPLTSSANTIMSKGTSNSVPETLPAGWTSMSSDEKLTAVMESLVSFSSIKDDVKILNSKFDDLNYRLKVLQTDHVTTKREVTELQKCLTENTGQITELANKLVALEVSTASKAAAVSEEINCLKNRMTTYPGSSEMQTTMQVSSELIVSGIPESVVSNLTPSQISSSIFDVLKVPELKADILCIRKVDVKSESSISINSNVRNRPPLHTFILKMKSPQ
ncbi:hypothetical protein KQX54_014522, partial [Cotesia glomerata]